MYKNHETGIKGEQIAQDFLIEKGYQILESNWRYRRAEIDLIAKDGDILVFVEVKTRSYDYFGKPAEAVHSRKRELMSDAASEYMELIEHFWEIRFDIVSIILPEKGEVEIEHFEDAFFK